MNTFSSKLILVALFWIMPVRAVEKWQLALGATTAALLTGSVIWSNTKNKLLMKAVENNWTSAAKALVQAGADVNYQAIYKNKYGEVESGYTPLLAAAERSNVELVQFFLDCHTDTEKREFRNMTALHRAAIRGHYEVAKRLIKHGAHLNSTDTMSTTPLVFALRYDHFPIAHLLIDSGADVNGPQNLHNETPLELAIKKKQPAIVQKLLDKGAVTRKARYCDEPLSEQESLLFTALKDGTPGITALLLKDDTIDVNKEDRYQGFPLIIAAAQGNYGAVNLLLKRGVDVNQKDKHGYGPALLCAIARGDSRMINLFLSHPKIDINVTGRIPHFIQESKASFPFSGSALELAVVTGDTDFVDLLLDRGAVIPKTLLAQAVQHYQFGMLKHLVGTKNIKTGLTEALFAAYETLISEAYVVNYSEMHKKKIKTIKAIIRYLVSIDTQCPKDKKFAYNLLYAAARGNKLDVTKEVLELVLEVYLQHNPTNSVLTYAYAHIDGLAHQMLACHGHDRQSGPQKMTLERAAAQGKKDLVELLLHLGAPVNGKYEDRYRRKIITKPPLAAAAKRGYDDIVTLLLAHGADPEQAIGRRQETALHKATKNNHEKIVDILLQHGQASNYINSKAKYGKCTSLELACVNAHKQIVQKLIAAGADIKLINKHIFIDILPKLEDLACHQNIYGIFELLLPALSPNHQDESGNSVLHLIAGLDKVMLHYMIQSGDTNDIDYDSIEYDENGQVKLKYFPEPLRKDLATLLLKYGARIDLQTPKVGRFLDHATPLHIAALCGDKDMLQLLLTKGYIPCDSEFVQQKALEQSDANALEDTPRVPTLQNLVAKSIANLITRQEPDRTEFLSRLYQDKLIKRFGMLTEQAQGLVIKNLVDKLSLSNQQKLAHTLKQPSLFIKLNKQRHSELVQKIMVIKTINKDGQECDPFNGLVLDYNNLEKATNEHFQQLFTTQP